MSDDKQTLGEQPLPWASGTDPGMEPEPALVIAWSLWEPLRLGECCFVAEGPAAVLGRDAGEPGERRLSFVRRAAGELTPQPPLAAQGISRRQLEVRSERGAINVRRVGRCPMYLNGSECDEGVIVPGDTLLLKNQLLLYCTAALPVGERMKSYPASALRAYAEPDAHGIVGESAIAYRLREEIAFAASSESHVLVLGQSGSGKELAARAIHALGSRHNRPLIARNAANFPSEIVDAELFGNVRDYPNPRMPERVGLIGEASGATLFLDEIGEMPAATQAHLLRVLDNEGEYARLGEARSRRADLRVIAATNRHESELRPDFLARFAVRVRVPALEERREDVPLIARALLGDMAAGDTRLAGRFFDTQGPRRGEARIDPWLVEHLLRRSYPLNVRELASVLWAAAGASRGNYLELGPAVMATARSAASAARGREEPAAGAQAQGENAPEIDRATVERALQVARGNITEAAAALGLKNRFALYRLMKRWDIPAA